MLPATYQLPAAIILVLGGIVSCFFGYRLFRIVLAIFGFILGALAASSVFGVSDTGPMIVAALVGGLIGAAILFAAYFVGVALIGAGFGAAAANLIWAWLGSEPHLAIVVGLSILGAIVALWLQRYVIIVATAFGGAWTAIVGALGLAGDRTAGETAAARDVWLVYPLSPAPGQRWVIFVWLALGIAGVIAQLAFFEPKKRK